MILTCSQVSELILVSGFMNSKRAGGHVLFHPVKDEWTYCSDGALGVSGEIVPIRLVHDWD